MEIRQITNRTGYVNGSWVNHPRWEGNRGFAAIVKKDGTYEARVKVRGGQYKPIARGNRTTCKEAILEWLNQKNS